MKKGYDDWGQICPSDVSSYNRKFSLSGAVLFHLIPYCSLAHSSETGWDGRASFRALVTSQENAGEKVRKHAAGPPGVASRGLRVSPQWVLSGPSLMLGLRRSLRTTCSHRGNGGTSEGSGRRPPASGVSAGEHRLAGKVRSHQNCR